MGRMKGQISDLKVHFNNDDLSFLISRCYQSIQIDLACVVVFSINFRVRQCRLQKQLRDRLREQHSTRLKHSKTTYTSVLFRDFYFQRR